MLAVQIRMARAALGWSIVEFAERAKVSTNTLVRLERGEELKQSTLDHLRHVLERAGIEFLVDNDGSYGVKFREARDVER
jgi:transcriptional regulator with XRE-family HTH domain